ncbi:MAG: NADH-quinone oxidoreductase subunit L [Anaerolineales bacterium]|nr:NADH-quinone oxidoreductase subunit L [Anaerolineales bacterium]MDW8160573.1 NADH-quinone oxidoreductase subunit L [Anaerolineales bacterium]
MTTETLIWLIPLPPLLAFFLIVLFTHRSKGLSHTLAIGAAFLSWLASMIVFLRAVRTPELGKYPFESSIPWLPLGEGWFSIGVLVDPLGAATLFFVAWTILMIFLYSVGYHNYGQPEGDHDRPGLPPHGATVVDAHGHPHKVPSVEPMYSRFFAFISLFAFGMYLLVVSDNLLTLFIGWEIMGLCSYLLIGFWYGKPSARAAMIKAFITTRVGDVFMLLGIAYLYSQTGTLNFRAILYNPEVLHALASAPSYISGLSAAALIGILLFIGTVGKSAQFPLHVWLPDAMEGPTPVSAMIHAATMVSAGVYMVIRIFPLLSAGSHHGELTVPMTLMAVIGAGTALFAATIAVAQNDIKRVLAYSTISQLGYMVAALGVGGFVAATFHLITHAFFKALLFLGSGSVIHGMEHGVLHTGDHIDPQNMMNMGGLRRKMPLTFWTFLIGGFALAGFPLITAGFWSKDEILADAFGHAHYGVFITLALAALLTAFYTMRQITLTFLGEPRSRAAEHAQETPWTMTVPLLVLAVFAISAGWVGIPEYFPLIGGLLPNWLHEFVSGTLLEKPKGVEFSLIPLLTSILVALGGIYLGWLVYRNLKAGEADPLEKALGIIYPVLKNKYYFDELYHLIFVRPSVWVSEVFTYLWVDRKLIDGVLHLVSELSIRIGVALRNYIDKPVVNGSGDLVAEVTKSTGRSMRVIQTGRVQQYMIMAVLGFVVLSGVFYFIIQQMGIQ